MVKVTVKSEEELVELTKKLLHILVNLRHRSTIWHEQHGATNLYAKKKWEQRADELIQELNIQRQHPNAPYSITVKTEQ